MDRMVELLIRSRALRIIGLRERKNIPTSEILCHCDSCSSKRGKIEILRTCSPALHESDQAMVDDSPG